MDVLNAMQAELQAMRIR